MQDGRLRTIDVDDLDNDETKAGYNQFNFSENVRTYQLLFKRFVSNTHQSFTKTEEFEYHDEKYINSHWDKMCTIPGRPDELIFVLGVSNQLLYTALPHQQHNDSNKNKDVNDVGESQSPFLAINTRADYADKYIYGTPVMQISDHTSRITSIAVSPFGHMIASGDEKGLVKILMLRVLDTFSIAKNIKLREEEKKLQKRKGLSGLASSSKTIYIE